MDRGGAVQMFRLSRGLAARGHDVRCVFDCAQPPTPKTLAAKERFASAGLELELYGMSSWAEHGRFRGYVKAEQPDAIHVHREKALRFVYFSTLGLPLRCFVTNRGTVYPPERKTLERWLIQSRKLDRVLAVAEAVRAALLRQVPLRPEKVAVVYGGVFPDEFRPEVSGQGLREEFGFAPSAPLIVHCGSIVGKKGIDVLVEAFARLLDDVPGARLLLVGGGRTKRLAEILEAEGLGEKVRLAGPRADVARYYAAADVVVCASTKGEGLTGSLREALAMARPVVSTAVAGNAEIVRHGETGRLALPGDAISLAGEMAFVLANPQEARRVAEAGRQWVLQNCDETIRSAKVEAIYREILCQKQPKNRAC